MASLFPGRLGKQCRERWCNHLDPSVKKAPWTPREDDILFNAQVHENAVCSQTIVNKICQYLWDA